MVGVHGIAPAVLAVEPSACRCRLLPASSESSIGFTLPEARRRRVSAIRKAFRDELASGLTHVSARPGMAVLAVVGDGMAAARGAARFLRVAPRGLTRLDRGGLLRTQHPRSRLTARRGRGRTTRQHGVPALEKSAAGAGGDARHDVVFWIRTRRAALAESIARERPGRRACRRPARSVRVRVRTARSVAQTSDRPGARERRRRPPRDARRNAGRGVRRLDVHGRPRGVAAGRGRRDERRDRRPAARAIGHGFDVVLANKKPLAGSWTVSGAPLPTLYPGRFGCGTGDGGRGLPISTRTRSC